MLRNVYQYKQSEQSPLTLTHWTQNKHHAQHMKFEICDVDWDSHENVMVCLEKKNTKKHPHKNVHRLEKLSLTLLFF